jgi:hypothetical protein
LPQNHLVAEGDSATSLAEQFGFFADTIWQDPGNAALRNIRPDMDILMPGDIVVIPDLRSKVESKPVDQKYKFRRKGVPAFFRMQLLDADSPVANQDYTLVVDGKQYTGVTDAQGLIEAWVRPGAKQGTLTVGDSLEITIMFGGLDPADSVAGIQKRLANLGFYSGTASGQLDDATKAALRQFQERNSLPVTGEPDQATKDKLRDTNDTGTALPPRPDPASA